MSKMGVVSDARGIGTALDSLFAQVSGTEQFWGPDGATEVIRHRRSDATSATRSLSTGRPTFRAESSRALARGVCVPVRGNVGRVTEQATERTKWIIHSERVIDDTRQATLSVASVELPDGVEFEQYVLRMRKAAMMVVLNGQGQVLMMWRHRFIIDSWVWELPGGYVDPDEDPSITAAREVEEETGWRPREVSLLTSMQPSVGTTDAENLIYVARGAEYVGEPTDINEAQKVEWIELDSVRDRMKRGEIVGAASQVGLLHVLAFPRK